MSQPNYIAVLYASVRYDKNLSASEKLFFAEITALTNMNGKCYASNSYFAELYGVANSTISLWIKNLVDTGHIEVEYIYEGKQIVKRNIRLVNPAGFTQWGSQKSEGVVRKSEGGSQNSEGGYSENPKDNNTLTESNNTPTESNKREGAKKFVPPSVAEVYSIMKDTKQAQLFVSFYESKGWRVGKSPMKDWRASVRGWMARNNMTTKHEDLYGGEL